MTRREFLPGLTGVLCVGNRNRIWQQVWHEIVLTYRGPKEVYKGLRNDGLWCMASASLVKYYSSEEPVDSVQRRRSVSEYFSRYLSPNCRCEPTPMVSFGPHAQECPVHVWDWGIGPGCWTQDRDIMNMFRNERSCI